MSKLFITALLVLGFFFTSHPQVPYEDRAGLAPVNPPCEGGYWQCKATVLDFEAELARLVNEYRVSLGLQPWTLRADLSRAQRRWAIEMVGPPEQCYHGNFGQRAIEEGYDGFPWGEIGACGYATPREALQGWIDSPKHHQILIVPDMTQFGVGSWQYWNDKALHGTRYWTSWVLVGRDGSPE